MKSHVSATAAWSLFLNPMWPCVSAGLQSRWSTRVTLFSVLCLAAQVAIFLSSPDFLFPLICCFCVRCSTPLLVAWLIECLFLSLFRLPSPAFSVLLLCCLCWEFDDWFWELKTERYYTYAFCFCLVHYSCNATKCFSHSRYHGWKCYAWYYSL